MATMQAMNEAGAQARDRSTRYDLVAMLLAVWMVGGVFIDGWAHINLASTKETFFTPWHGVLYSGFAAVSAWMAMPVVRGRGGSIAQRVPVGYGLGFAGLAVFGAGGVGDALWHEIFGIEVGIDALLSPTHLLLLAGGLLALTSPLRAAWHASEDAPGFVAFLPALLSVTLTAALLSFFFAYAWGGLDITPATAVPTAALDEQAAGHSQAEQVIAAGILARLLTTALLLGPLLVLWRRWRTPFGTSTLLFMMVSALLFGLTSETSPALLVAPLAAGLVADIAANRLADRATLGWRPYALAGGVALTFWLAHFAALALAHGLRWTPELWGGAAVLAVLTAVGMALLAFPPAVPASPASQAR